ncbi:hypothetical protein TNCV_4622041 [Trichonephila clavipes]|nr:hypothetical protein TNCV_4622041 [Trichonephila clavipes]
MWCQLSAGKQPPKANIMLLVNTNLGSFLIVSSIVDGRLNLFTSSPILALVQGRLKTFEALDPGNLFQALGPYAKTTPARRSHRKNSISFGPTTVQHFPPPKTTRGRLFPDRTLQVQKPSPSKAL